MWKLIVGIAAIVVAIAAIGVGLAALRAATLRRRRYQAAARLWQETAPERRRTALESLTCGSDLDAAAWYLLGCAYLQEGRLRLAARAFGVAHHADYMLETAALLTFACLKASEGRDSDIIEQTIRTWHEMREPDLLRRKEDHLMLDCLASTVAAPPPLSPLGRLIWFTVPSSQQAKMGKMLANDVPNAKALRTATQKST